MRALALIPVMLLAQAALAHDVPVNPSTCTLDPVELASPAAGVSAVLSAPGPADLVRVVYSVATATAQFQQRTAAPRTFSAGGVAGTLAFPIAFDARLLANGDLRADGVALALTLGGAPVSVPVTLTTAVAMSGGEVASGTPMADDGRFTLVGILPAGTLPAPLASATTVRLSCQVQPAPDRDQFAPTPVLEALAGVIGASTVKLRGRLRGGALSASRLTGTPAALQLVADGAPSITVEFPAGFTAQSARVLSAQAADGSVVTVRLGKGMAPARLQVVLPGVSAMPAAGAGSVEVQATLVAGAVTARGGQPFRVRGGTLRAGS